MISESASRSPEFAGCTGDWNLMCCLATVFGRGGAGLRFTSKRGRVGTPHLYFVALEGRHCKGDELDVSGSSRLLVISTWFFKSPAWVAAIRGILKSACSFNHASVALLHSLFLTPQSCLVHCAFLKEIIVVQKAAASFNSDVWILTAVITFFLYISFHKTAQL